ncbi:MAG: hypothetical protein F4221_00320, partial [Rhodothermaceae bacterium]|nr:hypothetical protein [Rhodothermaceae bacterium]
VNPNGGAIALGHPLGGTGKVEKMVESSCTADRGRGERKESSAPSIGHLSSAAAELPASAVLYPWSAQSYTGPVAFSQ